MLFFPIMKNYKRPILVGSAGYWLFRLVFFVILFCSLANPSWGEEVRRVALVPLAMNAPERMEYLRAGIEDMLSSRLTWENKVVVLSRPQIEKALEKTAKPMDESLALQLGKQLEVSVVLWGSINVFGSNVSLDLNLMEIPFRQPVKKFFVQAKGMDEVVGRINEIADNINEKVFARSRLAPAPTVGTQGAKPAEASPAGPAPEKDRLSLKGFIINPLSPQIIVNAGGFDLAGVWRSAILPFALIDLTFGDLDGDGKTETVLIGKNRIYIGRFTGDRFEMVKEIQGSRWDNFIAVDVGDIHGTGRPQIFITNYRSEGLQSMTLAWEQGEYKKIAQNIPYYFRIHQLPGRGPVLLGQKTYGDQPFDSGIQVLSWKNGTYKSEESLMVPKGLTIYNFAFLDIFKDGAPKILYLNPNNRINVLSDNGKTEYTSSEFYGGTINHITARNEIDAFPRNGELLEKGLAYIPARLVLNSGLTPGKQEIIVNRNKSSLFDLFSRYRSYSSGEILSISYEGGAMKENWRTQTIPEYIANYGIADFKNNGQKQLIVGVVQSSGIPYITEARSILYSYDLGAIKPPQK